MEIDAPTIMPEPVFEASGHLDTFDDMLIECPECETSTRADHLVEDNTEYEDAESLPIPEVEEVIAEYELVCPECGAGLADVAVENFNLMFATNIGPGDADPGYLRPETAQGIFVEFPRLKEYARNQLPFGVTQIGRAYRNEISLAVPLFERGSSHRPNSSTSSTPRTTSRTSRASKTFRSRSIRK